MWPNCDLKLTAFEKILAGPQGVDSNQPNYVNICTCLDILSFLLTILRKEQVCIEWMTFSLASPSRYLTSGLATGAVRLPAASEADRHMHELPQQQGDPRRARPHVATHEHVPHRASHFEVMNF